MKEDIILVDINPTLITIGNLIDSFDWVIKVITMDYIRSSVNKVDDMFIDVNE